MFTPRLNPIALSVLSALTIAGCAAPSPRESGDPVVQPVLQVRGGVAAYREALKRNPLSVEAYNGLGIALAAQRRYGEAIREFQSAVVLAPREAYLRNNLGYAYLLSGAVEKAVKVLEEATRLDPQDRKAQQNLRIARAKLGAPIAQTAQAQAAGAARPAAGAARSVGIVQVAPQVFELKPPPDRRPIEAVPLGPVPQNPPLVPVRRFKLEVSNGNGVLGMAKRTAGQLAGVGVRAVRITNQRPFNQAVTEVQYREGYAAEAAQLAEKLEGSARVVPSRHLTRGIDVRLVLGRDLQHQTVVVRSIRRSRA